MTKIAIIEDDPAIHQMYRMKFEAEGFDVKMADNGETGYYVCEEFLPDIILLDLQMPHISGVDCLKKIRAEKWGEKIPTMILTNLGTEEAPDDLDKLNVVDYIVKAEMTPKQVVMRVKKVLDLE